MCVCVCVCGFVCVCMCVWVGEWVGVCALVYVCMRSSMLTTVKIKKSGKIQFVHAYVHA